MSSPVLPGAVMLAPSPAAKNYDLMYYLKGAAAGGICCSITHGALTPVDVVKTRVQLDSAKVSQSNKSISACRSSWGMFLDDETMETSKGEKTGFFIFILLFLTFSIFCLLIFSR